MRSANPFSDEMVLILKIKQQLLKLEKCVFFLMQMYLGLKCQQGEFVNPTKAFPSWASTPQLMYRYDTVICSFIHSAKLS